MIRQKKVLFICLIFPQFHKTFFVLTFERAHYIPFDLMTPLPLLSPPPRTCFYTHEWNRKWHFPASFVSHQSLLVCVMEKKPSERSGSPSWSGDQGPLSVGRAQRSEAGFKVCECTHAHIHLTLKKANHGLQLKRRAGCFNLNVGVNLCKSHIVCKD